MDFFFRILIICFGYLYPAYRCFSVLDSRITKIEELQTWCRYWVIMAVYAGLERVTDTFISWIPFYNGGKLAFIVYLWHPDTKGTEYIYETYMKPLFSKHSQPVDQSWLSFKNQMFEASKALCNKALLAVELKLSNAVNQHVTSHPVHIQPFQSRPKQLSALHQASVAEAVKLHPQPMQTSRHQSLQYLQLGLVKSAENQESLTAASNDKEETDFELLNSSDIPKYASDTMDICKSQDGKSVPVAAVTENRTSSHLQGFKFLRWVQHPDPKESK